MQIKTQFNLGMEEMNMKVNGLYVSEWDDVVEIQIKSIHVEVGMKHKSL